MTDARFFNDGPFLDDEELDLLEHGKYAQHVISLLGRVRKQTENGVLALTGPWARASPAFLGKVTRDLQETNDEEG